MGDDSSSSGDGGGGGYDGLGDGGSGGRSRYDPVPVVALYTFVAIHPEVEMSINKGDRLVVTEQFNDGWMMVRVCWSCCC